MARSELLLHPAPTVHHNVLAQAALLEQSAQACRHDADVGLCTPGTQGLLIHHAQRLETQAIELIGRAGQDWHIGRAEGDLTDVRMVRAQSLSGQTVEYVQAMALTMNREGEFRGAQQEVACAALGETDIIDHHAQRIALAEHAVVTREACFSNASEQAQRAFGDIGERLFGSEAGRFGVALIGAAVGKVLESIGQELLGHGVYGKENQYFETTEMAHRQIQARAAAIGRDLREHAAGVTRQSGEFQQAQAQVDPAARDAMVKDVHVRCEEFYAANPYLVVHADGSLTHAFDSYLPDYAPENPDSPLHWAGK